ncbi:MAG: hypothetical protein LUE29_04595 [Lachnospiraceae bacterium]|nr:hypothetical protein [Lachnospiraceae bacterium]
MATGNESENRIINNMKTRAGKEENAADQKSKETAETAENKEAALTAESNEPVGIAKSAESNGMTGAAGPAESAEPVPEEDEDEGSIMARRLTYLASKVRPPEPEPELSPEEKKRQARERKEDKTCIYIFLVGLFVLLMKLTVPFDMGYPTYVADESVIPATQVYTLNTHYGAEPTYLGYTYDELSEESQSLVNEGTLEMDGVRYDNRVDLFNDFIGLGLMAFACFRLKKRRGTFFSLGFYTAVASIILKLFIVTAPYYLNGSRLLWPVFFIGIANFFMKVLVTYCFTAGMCQCLDRINYRQDRRTLLLTWFVMVVFQGVIGITSWVLLGAVTMAYNVILFFTMMFYIWKSYTLAEYAVRDWSVPRLSVGDLYKNSGYYQKKQQEKEHKKRQKQASEEIKERRRKLEEAKKM